MNISFDKLFGNWKSKQESAKKKPEGAKPDESKEITLDPKLVSKYKDRMLGVVYEEDDASTFAEMLAVIQSNMADVEKASEMVDGILDLLEMKERQIQAVYDAREEQGEEDVVGKETTIEQDGGKEEDDPQIKSVDDYITNRGK